MKKDKEKIESKEENQVGISGDQISSSDDKKTDESEKYLDQLKRLHAEFDNYRKRMEKVCSESYEVGMKALAQELLGVLDNFERAIDSGETESEGVSLIHKEMLNVLKKRGLSKLEALGKRFDHNLHHAVGFAGSDSEEDLIVEVLQPGYFWKEELIRPAMVIVGRSVEENNDNLDDNNK